MFRNKKGFTLVELIVVVAIMAMLAASVTTAIVVTQNKTKNSHANTCALDMANQIASTLSLDSQKPLQEYLSSSTLPYTWKAATSTTESGDKIFMAEMVETYENAMITDSKKMPKAGENKYLVTYDGMVFKVQYKEVGTSGKTVTFTVEVPDGGDTFEVTRSVA